MRERILEHLRAAEYLSGERLARELHCSRMAVWKHIEELKKEGYRIEALRRKGYRLLHEPDPIHPKAWMDRLSTREIGRTAYYFPSVSTTQQVAQEKAREGAPHGTAVIAEEQLAGRGRLGRKWYSPPGLSLMVSLILRPEIPLREAHHVTLLSAVAVAKSLHQLGYPVQIKWPNDLLLEKRKVCGILTELSADMDRVRHAVVGIGVNVYHRLEDFPEALRERAGSLHLYTPPKMGIRSALLLELFRQYEAIYEAYREGGFSVVRSEWLRYALPFGTEMTVKTGEASFKGKTMGLTEEGALLIQDDQGIERTLYSAELFYP